MNWKPLIERCVLETDNWRTISQIQSFCQDNHISRLKPSSPCVRNHLTTLLGQKKIVGMKGGCGANYFKELGAFRHNPNLNPPMPGGRASYYRLPPQQREARSRAETFNDRAREVVLSNGNFLNPFDGGSPQRGGVRGNHEVITGPIVEETRTVQRFCQRVHTTTVNSEALEALKTQVGLVLQNLDEDHRGAITPEDVDTLINEFGHDLKVRLLTLALRRREMEPGMVEDELMSREWWNNIEDPFLADIGVEE